MSVDAGQLLPYPLTRYSFDEAKFLKAFDAYGYQLKFLAIGAGVVLMLRNTWSFIKALQHLRVAAVGETVVLTHVSGTVISLRADGNVDLTPARNWNLTPKKLILQDSPEADNWGLEEILERFGATASPADLAHLRAKFDGQ